MPVQMDLNVIQENGEKIPNFSKVESDSDKNSKNESEEDHPYFFGSPQKNRKAQTVTNKKSNEVEYYEKINEKP